MTIHKPAFKRIFVEYNSLVKVFFGLRVLVEKKLIHAEQMVGHEVLGIIFCHVSCASVKVGE